MKKHALFYKDLRVGKIIYKFTGRSRYEQILAGAVKVSVPVDPHPRKKLPRWFPLRS
ncbi:MAG: hypothetical protein H8D45_32625 [Bacteroidetes bacterium]|nr:hypothetical protein [Bacteroidota bacterium]